MESFVEDAPLKQLLRDLTSLKGRTFTLNVDGDGIVKITNRKEGK
jgi:hypothetical protein